MATFHRKSVFSDLLINAASVKHIFCGITLAFESKLFSSYVPDSVNVVTSVNKNCKIIPISFFFSEFLWNLYQTWKWLKPDWPKAAITVRTTCQTHPRDSDALRSNYETVCKKGGKRHRTRFKFRTPFYKLGCIELPVRFSGKECFI